MRLLFLLLAALALAAESPSTSGVANYKISGSPDALVTLEIYTDYACPVCRVLELSILPNLKKDFIDTGKVRLIHRDFCLPQHHFSKLAARYANAAGEIGKFDIVATQLFVTQPEWSQNGNVDVAVAKVLRPPDLEKVRERLKNDKHLDDSVARDEAMAVNQDHLKETPTIVIAARGRRESIGGSATYAILKEYLSQKLGQ